jgi:hypothetical protein
VEYYSDKVEVHCKSKAEATRLKRLIRQCVGAKPHIPVAVLEGDFPPELTGRAAHYLSRCGNVVRHPSAYRCAYGRPIHVDSTLAVEVGRNWLMAARHFAPGTPVEIISDYLLEHPVTTETIPTEEQTCQTNPTPTDPLQSEPHTTSVTD